MSPTLQEDEPNTSEMTSTSILVKPNLKGDWPNIFLLLLLYIMQGMPLGLYTAVPIILQSNQNVTYAEQGFFSMIAWPFSLKLLWAPLVDSLYIQKVGRRKSWLIPVQFLMGICCFYIAYNINDMIPETGKPNILKLVIVFGISTFMAATQDIVVDGWALTMLQKNNIGYASTVATTGQMSGKVLSAASLVLLTSEDFSNKYLRITSNVGGVVTMKSLFLFWGILIITITTLIAFFKKEKDNRVEDNHISLNIFQNYMLLWDILNLPNIKVLSIAMLTGMIYVSPVDGVMPLKLIDAGMHKDNIMIIQTGMFIIKAFLPIIVVKYTSGPKPMSTYLNVLPMGILWELTFPILIYFTTELTQNNSADFNVPIYYYMILALLQSIHDIQNGIMTVALVAFFCRISDTRFGGTYMTLLNTLVNLEVLWSKSVAISLIDLITFKECSFDSKNNCSTKDLQNICKSNGGDCNVIVNGYYVEAVVCTIIGIIWYFIFKNKLKKLQNDSLSHWLVNVEIQKSEDNTNSNTMNRKT